MRQISNRSVAVMDACGTDLDKSQCGMESVRHRVRWAHVDFTDNALVPGPNSMLEQIGIEPERAAAPARRCCDHDSVHIDEAWIARTEPQEIRAVVVSILIERQQKGVKVSNPSREKRLPDAMHQPLRLQPGQLLGMGVVECKQGSGERLVRRYPG